MGPTRIAVHARLRPAAERDGRVRDDDLFLVRASDDDLKGTISVPNALNLAERHVFSADAVYGPETTQEELFNKSVKPLLNGVFKGINTTVFAYGVTGSGKTHTMQGGVTAREQGIIPRVMKSIFRRRDAVKKLELSLEYSYVQILNDEVWDLLPERSDSQPAKQLKICATGHGDEIVVLEMTKRKATSIEAFETDYTRASSSRKTAATLLNSTSSRSHAILTIYVQTKELDSGKVFESRISLVDLAGSEDNKQIGTDKVRARESKAINQSLTQLGTVVDALNTGAAVVPYRESKLTRILQETLGGNSLSILLLNLAPGEKYAKHTLRTLQFSTRARQVESNPQARMRDVARIPAQQPPPASRPAIGLGAPVRASRTAQPASNAQAGPSAGASRVRAAFSASGSGLARPGPVRSAAPSAAKTFDNAAKTFDPATQKYIDRAVEAAVEEAMRKREAEEGERHRAAAEHAVSSLVESRTATFRATLQEGNENAGLSEAEKFTRAKVLVEQGREMEREHRWEQAAHFMRQAKAYVTSDHKREKLDKRIAELELARAGQPPADVLVERRIKKDAVAPPLLSDLSVDSVGGPLKRSKAPRKPLSALAASTNRQREALPEQDRDSGKLIKEDGVEAETVGKAHGIAKTVQGARPRAVSDKENVEVRVDKKRKVKSSREEEEEYRPDESVIVPKKARRPERRAQPKIPVYVDISD